LLKIKQQKLFLPTAENELSIVFIIIILYTMYIYFMQKVHTYNNLTWIDIMNPTREEVMNIMAQYHLAPYIAEELLTPSPRPKVDVFEDCLFLVLHFPSTNDSKTTETPDEHEIDFIIGQEALITTHYHPIESIIEFEKMIEYSSIMDRDNLGTNGGFLFTHLVRTIYKNLDATIATFNNQLRNIETKIFSGEEQAMVSDLSSLNRRILDYRRSLRFQGITLAELERHATPILGRECEYLFNRLGAHYRELMNTLDSDKQLLEDLQKTNDMLLTTRTNNIMRIVGILAFILIPLSIGVDIIVAFEMMERYPMNAIIVLLSSIVVILIMIALFTKKRWL